MKTLAALFKKQPLSYLITSLLLCTKASAYDPANDDIPLPTDGALTLTGFQSRTSGNVQTFKIPISGYPSELKVTLRGGDGGFAQSGGPSNRANQASKGGGGILGEAKFTIHPTNAGALRPGGEIRLIPGSKGFDRQSNLYARAAGGGGGGSAILYSGPLPTDDWKPLMIAGGGGGGYASTVTGARVSGRHGGNGQASENGQRGGGNGALGGTAGAGGYSLINAANGRLGGGGGGWISNGESGGSKGYPTGGAGALKGPEAEKGAHGGFGCGGGGDGGELTKALNIAISGGGGGGYSGGGGGQLYYGGGGGGSYVAKAADGIVPVANSVIWTPRGPGLKQQGFVSIQTFGIISHGLTIPTITAPNIIVPFSLTEPYVDQNVTARDFYGTVIPVTTLSHNVDRTKSGVYPVHYETQDRFGQTITDNRQVTVLPGSQRPTFTRISPINVTSPGQKNYPVAENFQANGLGDGDTGETISSYKILGHTNQQAFEVPPQIQWNDMGDAWLVVTPKGETVGTSTVTIVAIDDGPDPTVVESEPQQVLVRFNMAPTKAMFITGTNPETLGTLVEINENTSNINAGTLKSLDPDNPGDLTYSLDDGPDAAMFDLIDGVLSLKKVPNYETDTPDDPIGYHDFKITITTKDKRDNQNAYSTVDSTLTIRLNDVNDAPSRPSINITSVPENTKFIDHVSSTDEDGTTVTYAVSQTEGADSALFDIPDAQTGALVFRNEPNYEAPTDHNQNNVYEIVVIATSGGDSTRSTNLITVTDAQEGPNPAQLDNSIIEENTTYVGTLSATDDDVTPLTYHLAPYSSVNDNSHFSIDPDTGEIRFNTGPDYEAPTDNDSDNRYILEYIVLPEDNIDPASGTFFIEVTNVTPTSRITEFRSTYNLASDGSDDLTESARSNLPKIAYFLFGLGDPSNPNPPYWKTDGTTGLPKVNEYENFITYTYTIQKNQRQYDAIPQVSDDLTQWTDPRDETTTIVPLVVTVDPVSADYDQITIVYLNEEDPETHPGVLVYDQIFFRFGFSPK